MKIHEYQAKAILKKYGVSVPRGAMAASQDEAEAAAKELFNSGATGVVVKAQIHAGGRGKGGGVKIAKSVNEAGDLASKMLGMKLVTHQTGPEGRIVRRLLIEETLPIEKELYLGILVDRAEGKPVFMASAAGGMEIEQVAAENPDAILKQHIDPGMGLEAFQARKIAFKLGLNAKQINPAVQFLTSLYKAFLDTDASLLEINPFITTTDGRLFALDAKINFDDNALFRHADLRELRDITEEDPLEVEASKYSLNYIKLDGNVGCMVNGAGLAMATMDIIKYAGGMPANFLDVGGGASSEQVAHAFEILLSDKNVKAVLINIFGGILRVDTLATGVVEAARKTNIKLPIVLRLEGTNVDEGQEDPDEFGIQLHGHRHDEGRGRQSGCGGARYSGRYRMAIESVTKGSHHGGTEDTEETPESESMRSWLRGTFHMAILVDKDTRVVVQGLTGREGTFHAKASAAYGTQIVGGVTPGQGRNDARGLADFQHRARGGRQDRRECHGDFCASAVRGRRHHGSGRCGDRSDRLHHRGHSDARHGEGVGISAGPEVAADRAELPGNYFAGQVQDRHHAGFDSQRGIDRHRLALGHADL